MDLALKIYLVFNKSQLQVLRQMNAAPKRFIVFSNTALGDTLLSTPALVSLRRSFPAAHIALFIHKKYRPLFEGADYIDEIIVYQGGFKRFVRTVMELRRTTPDTAVLLHSNGPQDIPMAIFSGARIILKHPTRSPYKKYLSYQFAPTGKHIIEERLELVRSLGATRITTRMALPGRYRGPIPEAAIIERNSDTTMVGFQVGAANDYRMWPIDKFTELARELLKHENTGIIITGNQQERALGERIVNACPSSRVVNTCGQFDVGDLPWLIRQMAFLVTNDTGTMHLAITLGVPTICLFGTSKKELIGPYQDQDRHTVIQKGSATDLSSIEKRKRPNTAMHMIGVDDVLHAAGKLLPCRP